MDNHASFTGHDLRVLCAKIDIHIASLQPRTHVQSPATRAVPMDAG